MALATVEIPDQNLDELWPYKEKWGELLLYGLKHTKIDDALNLYEKGLISFGRCSELAGLTQSELIHQARSRGIAPKWSDTMLHEELA